MSESTDLLLPSKSWSSDSSRSGENSSAETQLLGFNLGSKSFGIRSGNVVEIIRQVEVTEVPNNPAHIEGVIDVRGRIIPLINLCRLFQLGNKRADSNQEIIIAEDRSVEVGLIVDNVSEIITVRENQVLVPEENSLPLAKFFSGIVEQGSILLPLLDISKIVDFKNVDLPDHLRTLSTEQADEVIDEYEKMILQDRANELRMRNEEDNSEKIKLITFSLHDEWYALDINKIKEITDLLDIYYIPSAPRHVLGTINLRGVIVSVIDLNAIFGLAKRSSDDGASIIIVEHGHHTLGIIIDKVNDIIDLPVNLIEPPLSTLDKIKSGYLSGEAEWNHKLYGILKIGNVFETVTKEGF